MTIANPNPNNPPHLPKGRFPFAVKAAFGKKGPYFALAYIKRVAGVEMTDNEAQAYLNYAKKVQYLGPQKDNGHD